MDLLSLQYAIYVLVAAACFQACPEKFRPLLLTVASLLIYGFLSPVSAVIFIVVSLAVFCGARMLDRAEWQTSGRRTLTAAVLIAPLAYLLLIKVLPILNERGHALSLGKMLQTLGVSYYSFKLTGYVIDVYWRKYPAWKDPIQFLAFVSFFPQLPAGPIQRPDEFELPTDGQKTADLMRLGMRRILLGVVKKTVIADQLGVMIAYIDGLQPQSSNMNWIAACLYALQIYFDFAALTDIAIGTAAIFGISSPENFAYPFFAPSMSQFWRRWHMTLTFWLTDYVFTPLRMATRNWGKAGLIISLTVTMILIGLWHGLGVGFFLFGIVHSIYLVVDALTASARRRFYRNRPLADHITTVVGPFLVFGMFAFSLIFFRASSLSAILYQLKHVGDGLASPLASIRALYYGFGRLRFAEVFFATSVMLLFELGRYMRGQQQKMVMTFPRFSDLPLPLRWAAYYAGIATAAAVHQETFHFIYVHF
jgi:alginate O-acetyltransferase complex protein AlgI